MIIGIIGDLLLNEISELFIFRLSVKTKCLDVVYQPNAVKWLTEFICLPHQRDITQYQIEAMKSRTKRELIKNWEQILEGRVVRTVILSTVYL